MNDISTTPPRGILLFAHGARDPNWALPFEAIARRVQALQPHAQVRLAFLELMTPSLAQAGQDLVSAGCADITIVPLFLGAGGHVRRDLPALAASLVALHPQLRVNLRAAVGEDPLVIEALAAAAAQPSPPVPSLSAP